MTGFLKNKRKRTLSTCGLFFKKCIIRRYVEFLNRITIEGAGGVMVPVNNDKYIIDLINQLAIPVILVARSGLGTINHSILTLMALKSRNIPVKGIILSGPKSPHNRQAITQFTQTPIIAEIPHLASITPSSLLEITPEIAL